MATVYYDDEADLGLVQGRKVAVLGYGSQGHAHALSLRDSGCDVRVGLPEGSKSRKKAEEAGLTVGSPADVCGWADLIMVLTPDTGQRKLYAEAIGPNLKAGDALFFAHGFNVHFRLIEPRPDLDIGWLETRIAPLGFHLVLCTRRPETFAAAREERLRVSGKPSQYDDLGVFLREQELLRRLAGASILPTLELDISDGDLAAACDRIADWVEATGGVWAS